MAPWGTAYADRAGNGLRDCSLLEVEAEVYEGKSRGPVREAMEASRRSVIPEIVTRCTRDTSPALGKYAMLHYPSP